MRMDQQSRELMIAGGKIAAGAGPVGYGLITLNELALIVGILSSLVVMGHTLWRWYCDVRDRKRRAQGG